MKVSAFCACEAQTESLVGIPTHLDRSAIRVAKYGITTSIPSETLNNLFSKGATPSLDSSSRSCFLEDYSSDQRGKAPLDQIHLNLLCTELAKGHQLKDLP